MLSEYNMLDDRKNILDRIEGEVDEEESSRPIRESFEQYTDNIPDGPGGILGDGNVIGIAGYYAISTGQVAVLPIPGVKQPGYSVISHNIQEFEEFERHTVQVNAASKHIAEVVAEYEISSPSNIDYLTSEINVISVEEKKQRPTASTWKLTVDVADRGHKEE
jgi:hypothetical protein